MSQKPKQMRWKCTCAYDGSFYNGWQKQPNRESVQDQLEEVLQNIFRRPVRTIGAGRTDAGVHARGQVFHFDAEWRHGGNALLQSLRVSLPPAISPRSVTAVSPSFHAHLSAKGKRYLYRICKGWAMPEYVAYAHSLKERKINFALMKEAAVHFLGTHDFSAFAANRGKGDTESPVKTVWLADWVEKPTELRFVVEGGGFLYKMVRSMVGALIDVGYGKMDPSEIRAILASRKRSVRVVSAPAHGLCLEKVFYRTPRRAGRQIEI